MYGKAVTMEFQRYGKEILGVVEYLTHTAQPGDVVLPDEKLLGPILALTKCRVPLGYFSNYLVGLSDYTRREMAQKEFWKEWRLGDVRTDFLREVEIRYVAVSKKSDRIPANIPPVLSEVFQNFDYAVFKVRFEPLSEATPKP